MALVVSSSDIDDKLMPVVSAAASAWHHRHPSLAESMPRLLQQAFITSIPALITILTPVPPCRHGSAPTVMYSTCGFPSWNPDELAVIPSMSLLLSIKGRPRLVTSPDERDTQIGIFGLQLDNSAPHRPPLWHTPQLLWPTNRLSDVGRILPSLAACREPPVRSSFFPHSIAVHPISNSSARVLVLSSSGYREAIEWFDLVQTAKGPSLSWIGCTPLPNGLTGNRLFAAGDDALFVSMSQPLTYGWGGLKPLFSLVRGLILGLNTGDIRVWQPESNWTVVAHTDAALPTGVIVHRDYVYFSELGKHRICRVANPLFITETSRNKTCVRVSGYPDSLSLGKNRILFAAHPDYWTVWLCLISGRRSCQTPFSVYDIPLRTMKVKELFSHDGSVIGAASTVVEYSGTFYIGSILSDRIGFWHSAN